MVFDFDGDAVGGHAFLTAERLRELCDGIERGQACHRPQVPPSATGPHGRGTTDGKPVTGARHDFPERLGGKAESANQTLDAIVAESPRLEEDVSKG